MDRSSSGSSVHGILQTRILEWVAIPFSRGSSGPSDQNWVSSTAGRFFTVRATRETLFNHQVISNSFVTPWTIAQQALPSMGFPRQEYWSELPFPSPPDLQDPGIKPWSHALAGEFFTTEATKYIVYSTIRKKERNNAICSNTYGSRDYHTK